MNTAQMIARSRKRGYSDDTIIDTTSVGTNIIASTTGSSSQVHRGEIPNPRTNTNTTIRFSSRLNSAVSTTDSGIASRGNCVLRTIPSWLAIEVTPIVVASWKKPN